MKNSQTNTFTGGMQKDLNPMITPNNVLTDALNATITTMNGNENLLQNDMGNARVESAYLPKNYIPIGMKEYGGVVYIAAYNPITKHGQIGSFPSPQRNVANTSGSELSWNIQNLLIKNNQEVTQYSIKDEIFRDKIFHPGDMFSLVANLSPFIQSQTNPKPIKITNQLGCNENGNITLGVSVLDNNNNLVDITDTLNKYNISGQITSDGCIILHSPTYKPNVDVTRNSTQYNVFNSKIAGQLFLVTTLNTIKSVDVELDTDLVQNNIVVTLIAKYKYNCRADDILLPTVKVNNQAVTINSYTDNLFVNTLGTNYTQVKYFISIPKKDGIAKIQFIPNMKLFDGSTNVMNSLSSTISLNMNRIDTNSCNISDWRYYVNSGRVNLVWGLETYPKKSDTIEAIEFKFIDILNSNGITKTISGKQSYFGAFSWDIDFLNSNTIYRVELYRVGSTKKLIESRYIITTPLMNDCFFYGEDNYVPDYGLITSNTQDARLKAIYTSKNTINIGGDISINRLSQDTPIVTTQKIPLLIKTTNQGTLDGLKVTEVKSDYLVSYFPNILNQENYPCNINKNKISITTSVSKDSSNYSDGKVRDLNLVNVITDQSKNQIQYNFDGTTLNKTLTLNQHFTSKVSGNYKSVSNVLIDKVFRPLTQEQLFGYNNTNPWWLATHIWSHIESDRVGEINIYDVNLTSESKAISAYREKHGITKRRDTYISVNQDGGTVVYDKVNDYLRTSKGKPTVALWSSRISDLQDGVSGISLPSNQETRYYGMEYAWWLGSNNKYYLLQNAYIPAVPNRDRKSSVILPSRITESVKRLYVANNPKETDYNKTFYVINEYNLDKQYSVTNNLIVSVNPSIQTGSNLLYKDQDYLIKLNQDTSNPTQLDLFKFKYDSNLKTLKQQFEVTTNVNGFEDIIQSIEDNKNLKKVPYILENSNHEIFITDIYDKYLDPSIIYTITNKPIKARDVPELNGLLDLFSLKEVNGLNTLVVNPVKTSVKPSKYFMYEYSGDADRDRYLAFRYYPTDMESFKIDDAYFGTNYNDIT